MHGRIKLRVWSDVLKRWKTVYVKPGMLLRVVAQLESYNIKVKRP
jgi:hypothetical protein